MRIVAKCCSRKCKEEKWKRDNREHLAKYQKEYRRNNRGEKRAYISKYYRNNRDKVKASSDKWRKENQDKVRASRKKWRLANPDKIKAKLHRQRARMRSLPSDFTAEQWQHKLEIYGNSCTYCGKHQNDLSTTLEVEHVQPYCQGGHNTWNNVVVACNRCNSRKGKKTYFEYKERCRVNGYVMVWDGIVAEHHT